MELIVFSAVLIVSVIAHFFFWRDSKKRYTEYMERAEVLYEKLKQLEANHKEIDGLLDVAESKAQKMDEEINALRSVLFANKKRANRDN